MATTIESMKLKSVEEIRDDMLRNLRNSLIKRGIANPIVAEGSLPYLKATSLAQEIYAASAVVPLAADAQMADTAQGDDLVRVAKLYKLGLRSAGPSAGPIVLTASVTTPIAIPSGSQLLDPNGLIYSVEVGGSYTPGDNITVVSEDTGFSTNLPRTTVLRWVAPPPYVTSTALVGVGGLTGGVDAEDIEGLRVRVLSRIQNPPNGTNWPSIVEAAEASSTAVQKAFAFPAANGPSTVHVAVVREPTTTNKNRDVDTLVLNSDIIPSILAAFPEFVEVVTTTVQNFQVSVSFGIAIPLSKKASPAGPGGGWTDASPFPYSASLGFAGAIAVTSSTIFTVVSDLGPAVGTQICWLSTDDWTLRTGKVVSFTGVGPYVLTIDTPFVSVNGVVIAPGDFVFPNAERMPEYVQGVLDGFAALGPGEKTINPSLLPRAYRRPLTSQSWTASLQKPFLRNLTDVGEEVYDVDYLYRSSITPSTPGSITDAPFIFVPNQIGLYPLV